MSKKCCGIIYNENEKFCNLCGKPLKEAEEVVEDTTTEKVEPQEPEKTNVSVEELPILNMEEIDKITAGILGETKQEEKTEVQDTVTKEGETSTETENADAKTEEKKEDASEEKPEATKENKDEDEDDEDDEDEDEEASHALKIFGTFMIFLLIASILAVGLGVYLIMLNPFYRNHDINQTIIYDENATDTDINNIVDRPSLVPVTLEEPTTEEMASPQDSEEETQTDTDAEEDEE